MLGCKVPALSNLQKSNDLFDDVMSDQDEEAKDEQQDSYLQKDEDDDMSNGNILGLPTKDSIYENLPTIEQLLEKNGIGIKFGQ